MHPHKVPFQERDARELFQLPAEVRPRSSKSSNRRDGAWHSATMYAVVKKLEYRYPCKSPPSLPLVTRYSKRESNAFTRTRLHPSSDISFYTAMSREFIKHFFFLSFQLYASNNFHATVFLPPVALIRPPSSRTTIYAITIYFSFVASATRPRYNRARNANLEYADARRTADREIRSIGVSYQRERSSIGDRTRADHCPTIFFHEESSQRLPLTGLRRVAPKRRTI